MMKKLFSMLMFSIISAATALAYTDGILWQGSQEINDWGSNSLIIDDEYNIETFKLFKQKLTGDCDIYLKIEGYNADSDLRISGQWGTSETKWADNAFPKDSHNHLSEIDGDNVVKVSLTQDFVSKAMAEDGGIAFWGYGGFYIKAIATSKEDLMASSGNDPSGKEYKLVWSDEFNYDLSNWNVEVVSNPSNNELQYYLADNVTVENGNLVLTARRENKDGKAFTSGRVNSQGKVYFTHGKIEARIKMPRLANGLWPAFWMMGNDIVTNDWPACGEIDIMEAGFKDGISAGTQERLYGGTIHWGPDIAGHQQYGGNGFVTSSYDITGDYHTFTAVWDDTYLKFYLDNSTTPYYEATIKGYESEKYFHKPFHILFNLAVGGDFPGIDKADGITALPDNGNEAKMYVDYVRVYQLEGEKNIVSVRNDAPEGGNTGDNTNTVDPDREGINWDTNNGGAECMVESIVYASIPESQNLPFNGHDHKNATYYGVARDQAELDNKTKQFYVVAKLKRPITVSDVELVWGNGYPLNYEVYALTNFPEAIKAWDGVGDFENFDSDVVNAIKEKTPLYSVTDNTVVSYEPFFNTKSELQKEGNQDGNTQYIVVKMWNPMGNTFGFKLDEIHVGAYDDSYDVVDHIGVDNFTFNTERSNAKELVPTARNSRNAILTGRTVTSVSYELSDTQYLTIDNVGGTNKVWASFPGEYEMTITGSVDNEETTNKGISYLSVSRDWLSETTNTKSVLQGLPNDNFKAKSYQNDTENDNDTEFHVINIKDGNAGTRWSSGDNEKSATNQYITIELDGNYEYKIRALEFLWERAYPLTYAVYGLSTEPSEPLNDDNDDYDYYKYKEANKTRLIYEATLPSGADAKEEFPFHDFRSLNDEDFNELDDTKYLVVAFKEPITQLNGDKYGVSMWEMYVQATNMTKLNAMTEIKAPDMVVYLNDYNDKDFTVKATTNDNENDNEEVVVTGVTFKGADAKKDEDDVVLGTTVEFNVETNRYEVKSDDNILVAEIWDAGNNTYNIKTGSDRSIAGKKYNITASYNYKKDVSTDATATTTFILEVIKKPMDLISTDPRHLVFDDGYYVESRLEKYASPEVLTVDMTKVDFESDHNNKSLANTRIPAPRFLNKKQCDNGKYVFKGDETVTIGYTTEKKDLTETITKREEMNPNAIYYVNQIAYDGGILKTEENRVHGENVALKKEGSNAWYIHELRVFDGYNFAPYTPTVGVDQLKAYYGIFYTNVPKNKKSTIALPFAVSLKGVKEGIKFYEPTSLNAEDCTITLKKWTDDELENRNTYIIESDDDNTWSPTGGYAVALPSYPYKNDNENVDVAMSGNTVEIDINGSDNKAVLESSFVNNQLANNSNYYLYSGASETFRPANDDWFNYEAYPDHVVNESLKGVDCRLKLLPFFAYLKLPEGINATEAHAKGFTFVYGNDATGIKTPQSCVENGLDINAPMYDLMGRRVNSNYRGIIIQNGKKYLRR